MLNSEKVKPIALGVNKLCLSISQADQSENSTKYSLYSYIFYRDDSISQGCSLWKGINQIKFLFSIIFEFDKNRHIDVF